jgi:formylglycine-generating enzyme required for sulfatase activity/tRNA A-37 threonylcarbamoyl transferase component Bud32
MARGLDLFPDACMSSADSSSASLPLLPSHLPASLSRAEWLALVRADQWRRWGRGERVLVETYLTRWPMLADDAEALLDLIYGEMLLREERAETFSLDEYRRRFPAHEASLRRQFELHQALADSSLLELTGGNPSTPAAAFDIATVPPSQGPSPRDPQTAPPTRSCPASTQPVRTAEEQSGDPRAGQRFRLLRFHRKGGQGEVYLAFDGELNREVALKRIQNNYCHDADARSRFLREAEITGRLEHPGIVPVYSLGRDAEGEPYYAMRFIEGQSLQDAIDAFHAADRQPHRDPGERSLALRELLNRFVALCKAVAYAHSRGVIHRDVKPANVMLGKYGETLLVDWGLAKAVGRIEDPQTDGEKTLRPSADASGEKTRQGAIAGTPVFMSPEQARGAWDQVGPASDVYSLGTTLYALLAGERPFTGRDSDEVLKKVLRNEYVPLRRVKPTVPKALEALCHKAMAPQPEDRYASALALAQDVEHWLADEPVAAHREPFLTGLGRWIRRHQPLVAGAGALLLTAAVALAISTVLIGRKEQQAVDALRKEQQARQERAEAQVNALLAAEPQEVPAILKNLDGYSGEVVPRLRAIWQEGGRTHRRMRAGLALLAVDPREVQDELVEWMLQIANPPEMLLFRDTLLKRGLNVGQKLRPYVDAPQATAAERFRALVALAAFAPDDPCWPKASAEVVDGLLRANSLHWGLWMDALRPVHPHLLGPLENAFRNPKGSEQREASAVLLGDFARDRPDLLAESIAEADANQFARLRPFFEGKEERMGALLRAELARTPTPAPSADEPVNDRWARRQANVAAALLHLNQPEAVWPLFRHTPNPLARSAIVHRLGPLDVDPRMLLARLEKEDNPSARRALVLSLGEFTAEQLPANVRQPWAKRFLDWYRNDPDPGLHGAIDWLLRHGKEGNVPRKIDWQMAAELHKIDLERTEWPPKEGRRWAVNGQGQTLAVLQGEEFTMGSGDHEPNRNPNERQHQRLIGRAYALATKPVTVAQMKAFCQANPKVKCDYDFDSPEPDSPMVGVTWYDAAQYCRWLSDLEKLPEEEQCFPSIEEIEKCKDGKKPLPLPKNYLARLGYRLPTEAEWEYGCRAKAVTRTYYGETEELLGAYAWYVSNANDRIGPVGQKKPNDFGLFDTLGNAWQWCQEGDLNYEKPKDSTAPASADKEDVRPVNGTFPRIQCGGSFCRAAMILRCGFRAFYPPTFASREVGFRVARTVR